MNDTDNTNADKYYFIFWNFFIHNLNFCAAMILFLKSNFISKTRFFLFGVCFLLTLFELIIYFTKSYFKFICKLFKYVHSLLYSPFIPLILYIVIAVHFFFNFFWNIYILSIMFILVFFPSLFIYGAFTINQ